MNTFRDCIMSEDYFGIIFGTLGRQGNPVIIKRVCNLLDKHNKKYIIIMLNEVTEAKVSNYTKCECFVQLVCPRLSIDWPNQFSKPMLTPYEVLIIFFHDNSNIFVTF